jgi:polyisoprenyl-phosphate glycosyltransferase
MPFLSVVTGCYNEQENVAELCIQVREVMKALPPREGEPYTYEHIFIDNASTDGTVAVLRGICAEDAHVKVIVNTRNFGHIRSPFYCLLQAHGDAVISLVADLQDPPGMIRDFVAKWEEGYKVVVGVKQESREKRAMFFVRGLFYRLMDRLSEVPLVRNFTGFGLYDR